MESNRKIIDTNVSLLAGTPISSIPDDQLECAQACMKFIYDFISNRDSKIVLDNSGLILDEYKRVFKKLGTKPSLATRFYEWVCIYLTTKMEPDDYLSLTQVSENNFLEYPDCISLKTFDPPDRKFIALAYKHPKHPTIVQGSDSKWWGIKDDLKAFNITVNFLCEDYIKSKYQQKIPL